jgi:hypothetical protein
MLIGDPYLRSAIIVSPNRLQSKPLQPLSCLRFAVAVDFKAIGVS